MKKRKLIMFIGESGSGKTTTAERISKDFDFEILVSTTTREKRKGEREGKDYYYVSVEEFLNREMIESVEFPKGSGKFYGVQASEFERTEGKDMVLVVEPNGAKQIKEFIKRKKISIETIIIYMDIPKGDIRKNLVSDGISKEEIEKRLNRGNIPEDFKNLGLKADLTIKKINQNTTKSIIEWLIYMDEMYKN
jgi:guanylate kinase